MAKMVGLSRAIKREWLDKTVSYVLEGMTETEIMLQQERKSGNE